MTKNEIIEKIEALKNQISDLEKEVEKVGNEDEKKYPANGTTFYYLDTLGRMNCGSWGGWTREETEYMKLMFDSGEIFLTEDAAKEYAEVKQIERELFALADDTQKWNRERYHYTLDYSDENGVSNTPWSYVRMNIPYFASSESAIAAVEKVGEERVKKWLIYKRKKAILKVDETSTSTEDLSIKAN